MFQILTFEKRPWGWMIKFLHTRSFWMKLLRVTGRTSLQSHEHRTEYHFSFWRTNKIHIGEHHRMLPGWYLEIALGRPDENDIIRYEDDYGRIPTANE